MSINDSSHIRPMVEGFYNALSARDADAVAAIIDQSFAEDAVLRRPESLPGGGALEGAEGIKRLMTAVATMDRGPMDVSALAVHALVVQVGEDADHVVVELRFPFAGRPTSALEWWTVRARKVVEIRVYYWDTAAMLGR